jgi:hypothetical protein
MCWVPTLAGASSHNSSLRSLTGHTTTEVFASGGVHALIRLLDNVLEYATEPQRSVWVREVLALLYPLVRRSRMVSRLLVRLLMTPVNALSSLQDPQIVLSKHIPAEVNPRGVLHVCVA